MTDQDKAKIVLEYEPRVCMRSILVRHFVWQGIVFLFFLLWMLKELDASIVPVLAVLAPVGVTMVITVRTKALAACKQRRAGIAIAVCIMFVCLDLYVATCVRPQLRRSRDLDSGVISNFR